MGGGALKHFFRHCRENKEPKEERMLQYIIKNAK